MSKAILTTESASNVAPLLLKPREAAKALTISERTLWTLTDRGLIRCIRIKRAKRYDRRDLVAYIDSQKGQDSSCEVFSCGGEEKA